MRVSDLRPPLFREPVVNRRLRAAASRAARVLVGGPSARVRGDDDLIVSAGIKGGDVHLEMAAGSDLDANLAIVADGGPQPEIQPRRAIRSIGELGGERRLEPFAIRCI